MGNKLPTLRRRAEDQWCQLKLGWVVSSRTVRDRDVEYRAPQDVPERVLELTTHPSAPLSHQKSHNHCAKLTHAAPRQLLLRRLERLLLGLYLLHPCSRAHPCAKHRAKLKGTAPAHPCARGVPFMAQASLSTVTRQPRLASRRVPRLTFSHLLRNITPFSSYLRINPVRNEVFLTNQE